MADSFFPCLQHCFAILWHVLFWLLSAQPLVPQIAIISPVIIPRYGRTIWSERTEWVMPSTSAWCESRLLSLIVLPNGALDHAFVLSLNGNIFKTFISENLSLSAFIGFDLSPDKTCFKSIILATRTFYLCPYDLFFVLNLPLVHSNSHRCGSTLGCTATCARPLGAPKTRAWAARAATTPSTFTAKPKTCAWP